MVLGVPFLCALEECNLVPSLITLGCKQFDSNLSIIGPAFSFGPLAVDNHTDKCVKESRPRVVWRGSCVYHGKEGTAFLLVPEAHCTVQYGFDSTLKFFHLLPTGPICSRWEGVWPSWGVWSTPPLQPCLIWSPWRQGFPLTAAYWQASWVFNPRKRKEEEVWE